MHLVTAASAQRTAAENLPDKGKYTSKILLTSLIRTMEPMDDISSVTPSEPLSLSGPDVLTQFGVRIWRANYRVKARFPREVTPVRDPPFRLESDISDDAVASTNNILMASSSQPRTPYQGQEQQQQQPRPAPRPHTARAIIPAPPKMDKDLFDRCGLCSRAFGFLSRKV